MMERKIGDRFNFHGTILEVCKSDHRCAECFFCKSDKADCPSYNEALENYTGLCDCREDGEYVVFKDIRDLPQYRNLYIGDFILRMSEDGVLRVTTDRGVVSIHPKADNAVEIKSSK